jgi:hypothetical protein
MTNRTIVLSDLRAEFGPFKILDLEKVTTRDSIDQSMNLRQALAIGKLCLVKFSIVRGPKRTSENNQNPGVSKNEMETIIRKVLSEQKTEPVVEPKDNTSQVSKIVEDGMTKLMDSIRQEINNIRITGDSNNSRPDMPSIDEARLAEMQQKAIEKVSDNISGSVKQSQRKIMIKNQKLDELASEL